MEKYSQLKNLLVSKKKIVKEISFDDIANLPNSAYRYREWWGNDRQHVQALAWLDAGYRVNKVDFSKKKVLFERIKNLPPVLNGEFEYIGFTNGFLYVGNLYRRDCKPFVFLFVEFPSHDNNLQDKNKIIEKIVSISKISNKIDFVIFANYDDNDVLCKKLEGAINDCFKEVHIIKPPSKCKEKSIENVKVGKGWHFNLEEKDGGLVLEYGPNSKSYVWHVINGPGKYGPPHEWKKTIVGEKERFELEEGACEERYIVKICNKGNKKNGEKDFALINYETISEDLEFREKLLDSNNCVYSFVPENVPYKYGIVLKRINDEKDNNALSDVGKGFLTSGYLFLERVEREARKQSSQKLYSFIVDVLERFYVNTFNTALEFWDIAERNEDIEYDNIDKQLGLIWHNIGSAKEIVLLLSSHWLDIEERLCWKDWEKQKHWVDSEKKISEFDGKIKDILKDYSLNDELNFADFSEIINRINELKVMVALVFLKTEIDLIKEKENLKIIYEFLTWKKDEKYWSEESAFSKKLFENISSCFDIDYKKDVISKNSDSKRIYDYYLQFYKNSIDEVEVISSMSDLLKFVREQMPSEGSLFFRGQAAEYDLNASVYRSNDFLRNEKRLIENAFLRLPSEFEKFSYETEKMIHLKHYNIPSRYLDIAFTFAYPLAFAVSIDDYYKNADFEKTVKDGVILVGCVPGGGVSTNANDTVSLLSAIAYSDYGKLENNHGSQRVNNYLVDILNAAKKFSPSFYLVPPSLTELDSSVIFEPQRANERVANQNGSFIIVGLNSLFPWLQQKDVASLFSIEDKRTLLYIPKSCCFKLIGELKSLGVNLLTAYPDMINLKYFLEKDVIGEN